MGQAESILGVAEIRERRGITLEQIAESTKISVRFLRAIEAGDFKKLPGGIYNTNYIRQYCRAIDYDESLLLSYYYRSTGLSPNGGEPVEGTVERVSGDFKPASVLGRP
jgi:cytoskeletal protein RodZ